MNGSTENLTEEAPNRSRRRTRLTLIALALCLVLAVSLPPVLGWQRLNADRTQSLANMRRLAIALQLYAQDYDGSIPVAVQRQRDGSWLNWPTRIKGYTDLRQILNNPANPVSGWRGGVLDPNRGLAVDTSYALNRRFNDQFGPGPFPLDNLELSGQTALLVEAGPMWSITGGNPNDVPKVSPHAVIDYGDTEDRYGGLVPYPSTHGGRMAVAAADGHALSVRVEHYSAADGPHDKLYGRLGGDIYNWNGGHPNGEVDKPPRE
jgi:prepilin-type processing-associated H-X9-DG protein